MALSFLFCSSSSSFFLFSSSSACLSVLRIVSIARVLVFRFTVACCRGLFSIRRITCGSAANDSSKFCVSSHIFLTVSLQANQNITGLTLTTFGLGVYFFVGNGLKAVAGPP